MNIKHSIPLPTEPQEAFALQQRLAGEVALTPLPTDIQWVAAADVAYSLDEQRAYAGVVLLRLPDLEVVERVSWEGEPPYPYISGLFAFREAPCLLAAFEKLQQTPDVIMIDSQGIAHPRRFGLASHIGLALDVPTLGCAKTMLVGETVEPDEARGSTVDMVDEGEVVGTILRTQKGIKPVFVSVGHKADLDTAIDLVLQCSPRYRIPEPVRQAHLLSIELRKAGES